MVILTALSGSAVPAARADTYSTPLCVLHPQLCTEVNNPVSYHGYSYPSGHDEPSAPLLLDRSRIGQLEPLPPDLADGSGDAAGAGWERRHVELPAASGFLVWDGNVRRSVRARSEESVPRRQRQEHLLEHQPAFGQVHGRDAGDSLPGDAVLPGRLGRRRSRSELRSQQQPVVRRAEHRQLLVESNTGIPNNNDCLSAAGEEYVNYAIFTKSGVPNGPPDPLNQTAATFETTADTLEMNSGDKLTVDMHDTAAGLQIVIHDLTTARDRIHDRKRGQRIRPSALPAELGDVHRPAVRLPPDVQHVRAGHPCARGRPIPITWPISDEIGHFEYGATLSPP